MTHDDTNMRNAAKALGWGIMLRLGRFVLVTPDGDFAGSYPSEDAAWSAIPADAVTTSTNQRGTTMEDTKTRVDADTLSTIAALIAADLGARHGVVVQSSPVDPTFRGDCANATLAIEGSYGIFAMIIESAHVTLRCEPMQDGSVWVLVGLSYSHPGGGSNGSTIGRWWIRDGAIVDHRAG